MYLTFVHRLRVLLYLPVTLEVTCAQLGIKGQLPNDD